MRSVIAIILLGLILSSCQQPDEETSRTRRVYDVYQLDVKSGVTSQLTDDHAIYYWAAKTHAGGMVSVMREYSDNGTLYDNSGKEALYYTPPASSIKILLHEVRIFFSSPFDNLGIHQKIFLTQDEQKVIYCDQPTSDYFSFWGVYSQKICMINVDGSGFEELAAYPYGTAVGSIALAPDGSHILYDERGLNTPSVNIVSLNIQTKEKTIVRHFDSSDVLAPQYVPGTNDIVFFGGRIHNPEDDSLSLIHGDNPSIIRDIAPTSVVSPSNFPAVAENGLITNWNRDFDFELVDLMTAQRIPLQILAAGDNFIGLTRNGQKAIVATNGGTICRFTIFNTKPLAQSAAVSYTSEQLRTIKLLTISDDGNTVLLIGEHLYTK